MTREEAIKKVRWGLLGLVIDKDVRDALETLIPELRESEDERILKGLEILVQNAVYPGLITEQESKNYLAYLEKQKECVAGSSKTSADEDERIIQNLIDAFTEYKKSGGVDFHGIEINTLLAWLEKQKENKPAEWSEEDEKVMAHIIQILDCCHAYGGRYLSKIDHDNLVNKLKSLRPSWKPSEDEERLINTSISFLKDFADKGYENAVECIDWLKSKLNGNSGKQNESGCESHYPEYA